MPSELNSNPARVDDADLDVSVAETPDRIFRCQADDGIDGVAITNRIAAALRDDQVVLLHGLDPERADGTIAAVAAHFGLQSQLDLQSRFASVHGHRQNVGRNFMTVNQRSDYQFIPSHSEGNSRTGMQLASLYCYENTTDGGVSIFLNTDADSAHWQQLRELVRRVDVGGRRFSPREIAQARLMFEVGIPEDLIAADDEVLTEHRAPVPGVRLLDVLARVPMSRCAILERDLHVYWDNVASTDRDSGAEYFRLLRQAGLLKTPLHDWTPAELDNSHARRVWNSGVRFRTLFKARVTHKLAPGELVIVNNKSWTHSTSNWTPGSGSRKVVAAFA